MPQRTERCSDQSELRSEAMAGTASVVRSWLLVEHPGPWGQDAFVDGRLPGWLARELDRRCRVAAVRPLLIRRARRESAVSNIRCFAIRSGPEPPRIETTTLPRLDDVLHLDLDALGRGSAVGLEPHAEPVFLVCTHGRHDACCAERGRPLARALASAFANETWESSHFGGDRFAANVIAFPHGVYFGRVPPADGERIAREYVEGRLDLEHLRGRSCYPMAVQAAEHALRVGEALRGVDEVAFEGATGSADGLAAQFRTPNGRFEVRLQIDEAEPHHLTCRSAATRTAPAYRLVDRRRVD